MIIINTPLRKKFAALNPELRSLLLNDLGFLTLEKEADQLSFINKVSQLPALQLQQFIEKMKEKQKSQAYKERLENFTKDYEETVKPKLLQLIKKETKRMEDQEQQQAENTISKKIGNI
jgi:hypothetical protein